jgi:hypothetical protein
LLGLTLIEKSFVFVKWFTVLLLKEILSLLIMSAAEPNFVFFKILFPLSVVVADELKNVMYKKYNIVALIITRTGYMIFDLLS